MAPMDKQRFIDLALDAMTKAQEQGRCTYTLGCGPLCVVAQFFDLTGVTQEEMDKLPQSRVSALYRGAIGGFFRGEVELGFLPDLTSGQLATLSELQHSWDNTAGTDRERRAKDAMLKGLLLYEEGSYGT